MKASTRQKSSLHVKAEKRHRFAPALPGEPGVHRVSTAPQASSVFGFGGQGYNMADHTTARGYIYFPQLDTRKEVSPYTRTEGLRRARFLCANVGFAGRLTIGMGRLAMGTGMMPNPTTSDREWNKLARARMEAVLGSASTYDLAGKFNFYSAQAPSMSARYRDGDLGKVFARDEGGNLRVAFYEAHQIQGEPKDAPVGPAGSQFLDGVRVDRHNRALSYVIQAGDEAGKAVEIPAADFALLAAYERFGAPRGITSLKHAINNLVDIGEMTSYFKHGIKTANRIGFALTRSDNSAPPPPGLSTTGTNPVTRHTVTKSDGSTSRVKTEEVFSPTGGEMPTLPPGWDIKTLLDQRPHPNTIEFFEFLIRDVSLGCDWSPELLWSIWKLGGANTRYVMADAQSVIEKEQQLWVDTTGSRDYLAFLVEEMRMGRLRKCQDPEWWKHEFIPPARLTVDYGRDGKLHLEQIKSGALTFRRFFGWQGLGLDQIDHWMDEVQQVVQACDDRKFTPEIKQLVIDSLYRRAGTGATAAPEPEPEPDEDPEKKPAADQ